MRDKNEYDNKQGLINSFAGDNVTCVLSQDEFIKRLCGSTGLPIDEVSALTRALIKELRNCLLDGINVKFDDLGVIGTCHKRGKLSPKFKLNNALRLLLMRGGK